jgi:Flp pilus assembly protein TadD
LIGGLVLGWLLCPVYEVEIGPDGLPRLVDRNSLWRESLGVLLFVILLTVATGAATLAQRDDPKVKLEQGMLAFDQGDYQAALPLLEQAARGLPDDARAHFVLAGDYYNLRRYAEAAQAFEQTTRLAPRLAEPHFYLALSYLQLEREAEAAPHLRQYLTLAPAGEHAAQAKQILAQFE